MQYHTAWFVCQNCIESRIPQGGGSLVACKIMLRNCSLETSQATLTKVRIMKGAMSGLVGLKQEQIVLERPVRLNLNPGRGD